MTPYRKWMALGVLLLALAGSMAWAKGCFTGCGPAQSAGCCDKDKCCDSKCCDSKSCQAVSASEEECCKCCQAKKKTARVAAPQVIYVPVPTPFMAPPYYESAAQMPMPAPYGPAYGSYLAEPVPPPPAVMPPPAPQVAPPARCAPPMPSVASNPSTCVQAATMPPTLCPPPMPAITAVSRPVDVAVPCPADPPPAAGLATVVRAVGGQIDLQSGDVRATCLNMVLKSGDGKTLKLAVADRHVQVSGEFFEAAAERMTLNKAGHSLSLEGDVRLKYHKAGTTAEVRGACVVLNLSDGRMEVRSAGSISATGSGGTSAPVNATEKPLQVFDFWTGFQHQR